MSNMVDLWLDDDDIKDANTSGGFHFTVPEDAVGRGNLNDPLDDKAKYSWVQQFQVLECKFFEDEAKGKDNETFPCVTAEISFQVPVNALRPNGTADPNAGKQHRVWYRIVPAAMKNKQHPKFKANNFANGKLLAICRSIWGSTVIPQGQKVNLGTYFGGDTAPITGQAVVAAMKASKWNGERRDEITDYIPLEMQGQ